MGAHSHTAVGRPDDQQETGNVRGIFGGHKEGRASGSGERRCGRRRSPCRVGTRYETGDSKWLINALYRGRFALDVDGYNVGFLKKFSGLAMEADIVANDLGPDNVQKKHVANIKWTPGKATVGIGMGKGMYDWIKAVVRQATT